jgi:hypothetical protein
MTYFRSCYFVFLISVFLVFGFANQSHAQEKADNILSQQQISEISAYYSSQISAQPDETVPTEYEKLQFGTIVGQFFVGQLLGAATGFVTGLAAVSIFNCNGPWCEFGEFAGGAIVGYAFGSSLGVYAIGNNIYRKASYPAVLLGDVMGVGISLAVINSTDGRGGNELAAGITSAILPMAGAILAYSLSQKPQKQHLSSLINISDGKLAVSTPSISSIDPAPILKKQFLPAVSIVNFRF